MKNSEGGAGVAEAAPKSGHTPGPVKVLHEDATVAVLYDETTRIKITVDARETFGSLGTAAVWSALIAAAPDLLAALSGALDVLHAVVLAKHGSSSAGALTISECDRELCADYNRWRAALTKARAHRSAAEVPHE